MTGELVAWTAFVAFALAAVVVSLVTRFSPVVRAAPAVVGTLASTIWAGTCAAVVLLP